MNSFFQSKLRYRRIFGIGSGSSFSPFSSEFSILYRHKSEHFVCSQIEGAHYALKFETNKRRDDVRRLLKMLKANAKYLIFRE